MRTHTQIPDVDCDHTLVHHQLWLQVSVIDKNTCRPLISGRPIGSHQSSRYSQKYDLLLSPQRQRAAVILPRQRSKTRTSSHIWTHDDVENVLMRT